MDVHDATAAAEAVVETAEVDGTDPVLAECRGAHDTWLDSHVEVGLLDDGLRVLGYDFGEGHELCVAGALYCLVSKCTAISVRRGEDLSRRVAFRVYNHNQAHQGWVRLFLSCFCNIVLSHHEKPARYEPVK